MRGEGVDAAMRRDSPRTSALLRSCAAALTLPNAIHNRPASESATKTIAIASRLGYAGLVRQTDDFIKGLDTAMIDGIAFRTIAHPLTPADLERLFAIPPPIK